MLLVTGITGHSGRHFLQQLVNHKYEGRIRCVVRNSSDTSLLENSGLRIEKAVGDLSDQEFMDCCMKAVDTVLHIGSIFYSIHVIRAAVKNNVKRAIFVHTTGIYSKYKSASEEYKRIESEVKKIITENTSLTGLVILRPTMIYGNIYDRNIAVFIAMINKLRIFPVIDHGKNLLQPVSGRDLGKAYYQVIAKPELLNGDYVLSGEKPITMLDLFKLISRSLGKKTVFINIPLSFGVLLASMLRIASAGKVDYVEKVQRMGENRSFSHADAARDFGYDPMPLEEGIESEVRQYIESCNGHSVST